LVNQHSVNQHFVDEFLAETGASVDFNLEQQMWRAAAGAPPCLGRRLPEAIAD
jgi:hypothetical protein